MMSGPFELNGPKASHWGSIILSGSFELGRVIEGTLG